MATRHGSATVELPTDTEILITRSFEAPRALVWDLLTTPRHLLRWWGPHDCPLVACEVDLRPGGAWRYVCRTAGGDELAWHGEYRSIEGPSRIVSTEVFEGFPDAASLNTMSLNTMTLTEDDGVTTLQTLVQHSSQANRDGHVDSGMEGGMQQTFDRLDDLVGVADTSAERFRRIAGAFGDLVHAVPADAWDRPAPCEGWVARDVVRHLLTWAPDVLGRSGLELPAPPTGADDDALAPGWDAFAAALQGALEDPEVASRTFDAGPPGELSIETAISMLVTGDVLVHTWDLAAALGLADEVHLDGVLTQEMLVGMQPMDEMLRGSGHYGPKVTVGAGAPTQDQLIAFTGRDPGWRPPAA